MRYAGSSTIYYVQLLITMSSNLVLQSTVGIWPQYVQVEQMAISMPRTTSQLSKTAECAQGWLFAAFLMKTLNL